MKEMITNQEQLTKLQAQAHIDGKGTAHKKKVVPKTATAEDKNLYFLKKLVVNNISSIEEVKMFSTQGTVIHFNNSKVQGSLAGVIFIVTGYAETKQLAEMIPSILHHFGADSQTSLRRQK
ncbi:transcription factor BTF3-like [Apodemus sylvaticus]|uniref:transcription factor BTF3-like n=1 Tax=Apodemus sylvaticus TaxID=10129 RepID=UPI0022433595|nr:transcription factor BTF3-like [Apodemus sylvaticus]